jgi:hypothetical protein
MPAKIKKNVKPSTIENIDTGFYNWVKDFVNISLNTNDGYKKVPVLWLGAERAFQVKSNQLTRDSAGKLIMPLITVHRDSISKDPGFKGTFQAHYEETNIGAGGGSIIVYQEINQEKTNNFENSEKSKILKTPNASSTDRPAFKTVRRTVYNNYMAPVPTYITVMYSVTLRSEYQQQMNDLMTPFIVTTGQINGFIFSNEGWSYEGFIQQDFAETKNLDNMAEEERMFETKVQVKVSGYLLGDPNNRDKPIITKRETIVKVEIGSERAIIGDPFIKR